MEKSNRTQSVDIAKGILIILVVVAHAQTDIVHDIIFMFHMPLFFVISGFLMKCSLRPPAVANAFRNGRCAEHNGRRLLVT